MRQSVRPSAWFRFAVLTLSASGLFAGHASAAIRVMTYNVDADTDRDGVAGLSTGDGTYNANNVAAVVQAVARYTLAGNSQAPDVIALQELYGTPSVTLSAVVARLNTAFAGTGVSYAYDTTVTGGSSNPTLEGNGPNGLIYRTGTISVLGATNIGIASGTGAPRTPVRYKLQANGFGGANTFYLYDEHTKAGADSASYNRRATETAAVRADADALSAANANTHIIYTGDFNLAGNPDLAGNTTGSNEQSYQNLTAASTAARGYDPLVVTFTSYASAQTKYYTESDISLSRRYDLQLITGNTLSSDFAAGLKLIDKTYTNFGGSYYAADGTLLSAVAYSGSVATAANAAATGISLADLQNLVATTDHLPVIADYTIAVPEPTSLAMVGVVGALLGRRRRR